MTTSFNRPSRFVNRSAALLMAALIFLSSGRAWAGSYSQNFSTGTVGSPILGDGSTVAASGNNAAVRVWAAGNKALQLMFAQGANTASWKMPDLDAGKEIQSFDATFNAGTYRTNASAIPGAGW